MPDQQQQPAPSQSSPALVVGLDTASNRWHCVTSTGMTAQCGPLKGKQWTNADARRQKLYGEARTFFACLPAGSHVFCEEPLALGNGKTTRLLSLAAGAIWTACLSYDLYWYWVDVSAWKAKVVGYGAADKAQIQAFVQESGQEYPEEDFYDAHCVRAWGEAELELQGVAILK